MNLHHRNTHRSRAEEGVPNSPSLGPDSLEQGEDLELDHREFPDDKK